MQAFLLSSFVGQTLHPIATAPNKKDLLIKELVEAGKVTPVTDKTSVERRSRAVPLSQERPWAWEDRDCHLMCTSKALVRKAER
jgi:hypothetical protein